jgi:hypothetical protein
MYQHSDVAASSGAYLDILVSFVRRLLACKFIVLKSMSTTESNETVDNAVQ